MSISASLAQRPNSHRRPRVEYLFSAKQLALYIERQAKPRRAMTELSRTDVCGPWPNAIFYWCPGTVNVA
jgi:hypothetical protein